MRMNRRYLHRPGKEVYENLRLRATVPLPFGLTAQVRIHPLLCHNDRLPAIIYNLNFLPETATISSKAHRDNIRDWFSEPALIPYDADSFVINIEGVDRPVVIVAATGLDPKGPFTGFITIWDVLHSCHLAWNDAHQPGYVGGSLDDHSSPAPYRSNVGGSLLFSSSEDSYTATMGNNLVMKDSVFDKNCFWDGLVPSVAEEEAWTMKVSSAMCRQ